MKTRIYATPAVKGLIVDGGYAVVWNILFLFIDRKYFELKNPCILSNSITSFFDCRSHCKLYILIGIYISLTTCDVFILSWQRRSYHSLDEVYMIQEWVRNYNGYLIDGDMTETPIITTGDVCRHINTLGTRRCCNVYSTSQQRRVPNGTVCCVVI